ncbi:MAG TPA: SGNH/GDSL hydrolase family protein [Solirubrobacteraceae bacterium]
MRTTRSIVALAGLLAVLAVAPAAAAAAQWVGLGDSYAAGPLIPNQSLSPLGCLRSDHNFAHLAAAQLGYTLADVSCSGATTADMTQSQSTDVGTNPPQFNALSAATEFVSVQISGNDIGFTNILESCATANPFGHPCKDKFDSGGVDQISARIAAAAPKVAAVLDGIHARSPGATVLLVDYAAILPETGLGCWPQVPFAWADVPYLRAKEKELNAMLATQAGLHGAELVDDYTAGIGHDACKSPSVRWVEPLVPATAAAPFHPNARGEAGVAAAVVAAAR